MGWIFIVLIGVLGVYFDSWKFSGLKWYEIKGVTKWLLKGPEPDPLCRGCGEILHGPGFREEIGYGQYLCDDCYHPIALESGLEYPRWWTRNTPGELGDAPSPPAIPPPSTCMCPTCREEHPFNFMCVPDVERYVRGVIALPLKTEEDLLKEFEAEWDHVHGTD